MQQGHLDGRRAEFRAMATRRTIDVTDQRAMRFWSRRLGVPQEAIAEAVREVGPNATAVALKLEAPRPQRTVPESLSQR